MTEFLAFLGGSAIAVLTIGGYWFFVLRKAQS